MAPPKIVKQVSFQEFMKSKRQSVTAEMEKSKTPNKKNDR